jgi:hypothetical protein
MSRGDERGFDLIFLIEHNLVISQIAIKEAEEYTTRRRVMCVRSCKSLVVACPRVGMKGKRLLRNALPVFPSVCVRFTLQG